MTKDEVIALAGPRQTIDQAKHPELGEGWAVYGHGPAFFAPAGGVSVVPMRRIDLGGFGVRGSWLRATTEAGDDIQLDTTKRARGDRHTRRWHPRLGDGWLVDLGGPGWRFRFEADSGESLSWEAEEIRVGKPGKEPPRPKAKKPGGPVPPMSDERIEWERWFTYTTPHGEVFVFRVERPTPKVEEKAEAPAGQVGLFGGGAS